MKARRAPWLVRVIGTFLAALGPTLIAVGVVGAVGSAIVNTIADEHGRYGHVPIPGQGTVHLPLGTATIYLHAHSDKFGDEHANPEPDGLSMTLIPPDGVARPRIYADHSGISSTNNNGWISEWKADIVVEGDYLIQTDVDVSGYRNPRLEFGRDSATWWVTWYFFYAGLCGVGVTCLWWLLEQVRSGLRSRLARRS